MKTTIIILIAFFASVFAFPKPPVSNLEEEVDVERWDAATTVEYLGRFGYISKRRMTSTKVGDLLDMKSYSKAITEFQRMAGLKPTGEMDRNTAKMMSMPRCGVEDTVGAFMMGSSGNMADSKFRNKNQRRNARRMKKSKKTKKDKKHKKKGKSRQKRYNLEGGKWNKNTLNYHILNYTPDMSRSQVKKSIKDAFNIWANYTTLKFLYTSDPNHADLKISFGSGNHGDDYPFDGNGGTLAHAFFPSDGRAHFDEAETFTFKGNRGTNLFIVAAHEFGHSLGLAHSSVPNSLMAPFYQGYVEDFTLPQDDIAAIQQLYGKKVTSEKKLPPKPAPTFSTRATKPTKKPKTDAMKICGNDISFDAMLFNHKENSLYALKGIYYWKINDNGVVQGYPKKINRYWKGLPGNINAAVYSKTTGRTYFFKGSRMWRYNENRILEGGFPRRVSDVGLPSSPEAAMQWQRDGKIYVFKKSYFYVFSEYSRYDGSQRAPRAKTEQYFDGIPQKIDSAIQWKNGRTYFFKGEKYWRFSGLGKPMDEHYPKSIKKYWIGCTNKTDAAARLTKDQKKKKTRTNKKRKKNKKPKKPKTRGPILGRLVAPPPKH